MPRSSPYIIHMEIICAGSFVLSMAVYIGVFAWRKAERSRQIVLFYESVKANQPQCSQFDYQREAQDLFWK
jgi:hypothetical protein